MRLKTIGVAAALAATVLASAAAAQDEPRRGGTIIVALNADIRSTDPGIDRDANTDTVMHHVTETLVAYRDDLSIGPALAEFWTISEDGRTYTFTLRDGAKFHNGKPVTSAEVKWSWERRFDPDLAWPCAAYFDGSSGLKVVAVETPDPRTVVFRLAEPNALFLAQLANIQCNAAVIHPDSLNAEGGWDRPIGTGPYMLKEWRKGQHILLERFADYVPLDEPKSGYAGARIAYADEVKFLVIPDTSVAEAALYSGAVDLLPGLSAQKMSEAEKNGATVQSTEGLAWTAILVQTNDPLLSDLRMRRAIAHALDISQIAALRTNGLAGANPSAVPQNSAFFDEDFLAWPEYDPAKARALLAEAGYSGQPIEIQTNTRYEGMYQNAVIMQAMLASVGINAQLEVLDWATQLDNYLTGKFQIQSFGYSARLDPSLLYGILIGDKAEDPSVQWQDPKALDLLAESMRTTDFDARKEVFHAIHARMAEQIPIYGLYYEPVVDAVGPKLRDYAAWSGDKPRLWGVWKDE